MQNVLTVKEIIKGSDRLKINNFAVDKGGDRVHRHRVRNAKYAGSESVKIRVS